MPRWLHIVLRLEHADRLIVRGLGALPLQLPLGPNQIAPIESPNLAKQWSARLAGKRCVEKTPSSRAEKGGIYRRSHYCAGVIRLPDIRRPSRAGSRNRKGIARRELEWGDGMPFAVHVDVRSDSSPRVQREIPSRHAVSFPTGERQCPSAPVRPTELACLGRELRESAHLFPRRSLGLTSL